jgi:hypothetical protein
MKLFLDKIVTGGHPNVPEYQLTPVKIYQEQETSLLCPQK